MIYKTHFGRCTAKSSLGTKGRVNIMNSVVTSLVQTRDDGGLGEDGDMKMMKMVAEFWTYLGCKIKRISCPTSSRTETKKRSRMTPRIALEPWE